MPSNMQRIAEPQDDGTTKMLDVPLWLTDLKQIAKEAIEAMDPGVVA